MRAAMIVAVIALVATASAAPRKHGKTHGKPAATKKAAGSGSGSGSAPAPAPAPDAAAAAAAAPDPAPAPDAAAVTGTGEPPSAAPGAGLSPAEPPPMAPRLAMRARATHGGFVDDLDCSACHTSSGWELAQAAGASGFDHDRTGFPLRGAHVQTSCGGCHTGKAKPANNCEGCHRDPHQGRQQGACAECHTATAWTDTAILERHRATRMPLTGRHATIDCSDCHKRQGERQFSDTPSDCFACHAKEYHLSTTHPNHDGAAGGVPFPRDCAQCHQTTAWSPAFADPNTLPRNSIPRIEHDAVFALSTGSHRLADCASCHDDPQRPAVVRCDGCHTSTTLRAQHRAAVSPQAAACMHCHPRGAAR